MAKPVALRLGSGGERERLAGFVPLGRGGELAVDERAFRLALSVGVPMNRRPAWFAVLEFNRAAEVAVVPPGFPAAMLHAIFVTALGLFPALDCPPLGLAGVRLWLADDVPTLFLQLKTMLLDETFAFGLANRRRGGNRLGSRLGLRGGLRGGLRLNGLRRFRGWLRNRLGNGLGGSRRRCRFSWLRSGLGFGGGRWLCSRLGDGCRGTLGGRRRGGVARAAREPAGVGGEGGGSFVSGTFPMTFPSVGRRACIKFTAFPLVTPYE